MAKKFTAIMSFKVSPNTIVREIKAQDGNLAKGYSEFFVENMGKYIKKDFREVNSFKEAQERFRNENPEIFAQEDVQISIMPSDENGRLDLVSLDLERDSGNLYQSSFSFKQLGEMKVIKTSVCCSFEQAYLEFKESYPEILADEFCVITIQFKKPLTKEQMKKETGYKGKIQTERDENEIMDNLLQGKVSDGNSGKYFGMLEFKISQRTIEREYENTPSPNADGTIDAYEEHMGEFESFCSRYFNSYEEAERFYETNYPTIWNEEETQITLRRVKKEVESGTKISDDIFATD